MIVADNILEGINKGDDSGCNRYGILPRAFSSTIGHRITIINADTSRVSSMVATLIL